MFPVWTCRARTTASAAANADHEFAHAPTTAARNTDPYPYIAFSCVLALISHHLSRSRSLLLRSRIRCRSRTLRRRTVVELPPTVAERLPELADPGRTEA